MAKTEFDYISVKACITFSTAYLHNKFTKRAVKNGYPGVTIVRDSRVGWIPVICPEYRGSGVRKQV